MHNQPSQWLTFAWSYPDPHDAWPEPHVPTPYPTNHWVQDEPHPSSEAFLWALFIWISIIAFPNGWINVRATICWLIDTFRTLEAAIEGDLALIMADLKKSSQAVTGQLHPANTIQAAQTSANATGVLLHKLREAITRSTHRLHSIVTRYAQILNSRLARITKLVIQTFIPPRDANGKPRGWAYATVTESAHTYVSRMDALIAAEHRRACARCTCPVPQLPELCMQEHGHNDDDKEFIHKLLHEYTQNEVALDGRARDLASQVDRLTIEKAILNERLTEKKTVNKKLAKQEPMIDSLLKLNSRFLEVTRLRPFAAFLDSPSFE